MEDNCDNVFIDEEYSDDSLLNLISYGADLSVRELVNMFEEEELVKPSLQRNYVWDRKMASRFIDSILLGLPVPSIFLAKDDSEKLLIVDGFQRITTLVDYFKGIFSKTQKKFKLTNSDIINEKWRNKTFSELSPDFQRRIKNYTLHAIIFERKTNRKDDTAMYQIFERINTGGRVLSPQEIRNCVYHGEFNNMLKAFNQNPKWRDLYGSEEEERMKDVELLLRFIALRNIPYSNEKIVNLNKFLNEYMGKNQHFDFESEALLKSVLTKTIDFVSLNFGELLNQKRLVFKKRFGKTLVLESLLICSYIYLESHIESNIAYDKRLDLLLNDEEYFNASNSRTTDAVNIKTRLSRCLSLIFGIENES